MARGAIRSNWSNFEMVVVSVGDKRISLRSTSSREAALGITLTTVEGNILMMGETLYSIVDQGSC